MLSMSEIDVIGPVKDTGIVAILEVIHHLCYSIPLAILYGDNAEAYLLIAFFVSA